MNANVRGLFGNLTKLRVATHCMDVAACEKTIVLMKGSVCVNCRCFDIHV